MKQHYCEVGGQALIEGIMMRNKEKTCVSVRRKDGSITDTFLDVKPVNKTIAKIPLVRGLVSFASSMKIGMQALEISADYMAKDEEIFEEQNKETAKEIKDEIKDEKKESVLEKVFYPIIVAISFIVSIVLFVCLPAGLSLVLKVFTDNRLVISIFEGFLRILIFICYIKSISLMPDIKRTFKYHGAEHKCLNCIEHGLELNVENVMKSSKEHKRCGTSFLVYIMLVSIIIFSLLPQVGIVQRMLLRLLIIPLIAGLSYELLMLLGKCDNALVNILIQPGLWMQNLTTYEPDEKICEVAIESIENIFDWKKWQEKTFKEKNAV